MNFYRISLHRELLEDNIKQHSPLVKGEVLDAGSKNRRYDSLFKSAGNITAVDIKPETDKGVMAADITRLPFRESCFDTVLSFEVLEYIMDTGKAISEISRVLKPEGLFIFSVPFLDPVHGDIDNVRYSIKGWERLLDKDFEIRKSIIIGGRYSLIWDFYFEKVRNNYSTVLRLILAPVLALFKKIAIGLDKRQKNWRFPMGYFFVCKKKR